MLKGIIFDLDGTIVLSENIHRIATNKALNSYGFFADMNLWKKKYQGIEIVNVLKKIKKEFGYDFNTMDMALHKQKIFHDIFNKHPHPLVKGFKQFLLHLTRENIPTIIGSASHAATIRYVTDLCGIKIQSFVSADDVSYKKPHPQLFNLAAKRLCIPKDNLVVFEDSLPGIEAAKRAGIKVIALTTNFPNQILIKQKPNMIIEDYRKINIDVLNKKLF